jgi:hypothetical protein
MDGVTGSIILGDPGVDRLHRILYLISYHLIIQRTTHFIFLICGSHSLFPRLHVDLRNCVDPRSRIVSYLLTLFLRSASQNLSLSRIPFWMLRGLWRSVDEGLSVLWFRRFTIAASTQTQSQPVGHCPA